MRVKICFCVTEWFGFAYLWYRFSNDAEIFLCYLESLHVILERLW